MAIGDNFDTTPPGFTNQTTSRRSGHGRISQYPGHYSDDNKGHPCNKGCGCKTACHEGTTSDPDARCQLPPELTIYVTTASSRDYARNQIANGTKTTKVHLVHSNGAWRGRRCCEFDSDDNELCDPCDVTTDKNGNKTDCSYGGQEGTTRSRPPGGTRRINPDSPRQADPDRTNCWQDGDIPEPLRFCASYTDANFNNLYGQIGSDKCSGGFCIDGSGAVNNDNEKTCCENGFTWKYQRCLDSSGNPVLKSGGDDLGGRCEGNDDTGLALDGSTCASKPECDCKFAEGCGWVDDYNEWNCLAKFKSDGYTWSHNWISDSSGNPQDCCSQELISDRSPSHQPNISSGEAGFDKSRSQGTCLTPYAEYILIPGGVPSYMGCQGVDNPTPEIRTYLADEAGSRGVFTLIIRDCDYNKNCLDSEGAQDASKIGKETILYIPIDQMINCSDLRLPHDINTGALGNPAGWYPDDVMACASPDENGDGQADANGSGCSTWIYAESGADSPRRVHPPGNYNLHKLNIKAQPFKATESKQTTVKTLKQAQADMGAHQACICNNGGDYPLRCPAPPGAAGNTCGLDIDHGLGFWFENDYIGGPSNGGLCESVRGAISSLIPYHWEDAWTCRDECGRMTDKIHYKTSGISSLIWQSALVGDSGLYTGRLDYWGDTGLAPFSSYMENQPENSYPPISHVLDNCYGTHRGGRSGVVEFASNTSPIVIKSTNHGLRDRDFINVKGVMGNFSANTLKLWEWKAIGWQEKTGEVCAASPEECDATFNPPNLCTTGYNGFDTSNDPGGARRLEIWVIEVVDKDHFILKDCTGADSDGSIHFGCEDADAPMTCVDYNGNTIGECPCNELNTSTPPDVISSPAVDLLVDEATCESYGYCQVISTPPGANTMTTKAHCITLAQHWGGYDSPGSGSNAPLQPPHPGSCTDGCTGSLISATDEADCLAQSSQSCMPNTWQIPLNYHTCVDQSQGSPNFDACWLSHSWERAVDADPYEDKVRNWPCCPFTGEWRLCDQTDKANACEIHETSIPRSGTDQYRLGYDHTAKMIQDLANDYYVQIDQTEVCPVCCDHYMPRTLTATIGSSSTERLNDLYCEKDCNGVPLPPRDALDNDGNRLWVHPGGAPGDTPYVCEKDTVTGLYGPGCVPGVIGGKHCCDCLWWPRGGGANAVIAGCFDCGLTYRIEDDWIDLGDPANGADAQMAACCSCDCEPGDSKKPPCEREFPSLEDFFMCEGNCSLHGSESVCNTNGCTWDPAEGECTFDGCSAKMGKLTCVEGTAGSCGATYDSCNMVGGNCDGSDPTCAYCSSAPGCTWEENPPGMGTYQCTGAIDNSACDNLEQAPCNAETYCDFRLSGICDCTPCAGFPNGRELKCEEQFICAGPNNKGNCEDQPPQGLCDGGPGDANPDGKGCGPPGMPGSIADCVMPDREYKTGCPGLETQSFSLNYNGSTWVSDWVAMGDVGKKQCKLQSFPEFCSGKCCVKGGKEVIGKGGASCESVGGTLQTGCPGSPVPGADCGACRENAVDECLNCGPDDADDWPTEKDNHYIRVELYCGDMEIMSQGVSGRPRYGGLMSDESYESPIMQSEAWITTCMYPSCGAGNTLCPESGCFGDCSTAQLGELEIITSPAHIPGINCGPRSPCIGCCGFVPPFCEIDSNGNKDCPTPTTSCGVPCAGACEDGSAMGGYLAMVECHVNGKQPIKRKQPEVFQVRHVQYTGTNSSGPISGKLFASPVNSADNILTGCSWPVGTTVSLGEASRRVAETGGDRGFDALRPKSSTDILSLTPNYPGSTTLTTAILPDDYPSDDPLLYDPGMLMEIQVDDVRAFMTRSGSQDRHLWRNSNNEVFPYGVLPWPVPHQTQGDPAALNNLGRIGKVVTQKGSEEPSNEIATNGIENIYSGGVFQYIQVTTVNPHDLLTGEKIILDRAECLEAECACSESNGWCQYPDGSIIRSGIPPFPDGEDPPPPVTSITGVDEATCTARNGTWSVTDEKILSCPRECQVNGWWDVLACDPNECFSPNCRKPPDSPESPKVCYGCQGSAETTEIIDDPITGSTEVVEVDLNGPYVVKVISSTVFSLHYEKNLDFETISSKIFGYDPTTNVPNPVPPTPPVTPTGPDPALNTKDDKVEWDASVEATEWGHEVMVGPAVGPFTNKEIDWASMSQNFVAARWTRHAGRFYVVLNHFEYVDKPGTACRQGNSQNPVNLNFDLLFENACCNNRQPPHNMKCQGQCYQGGGPVILDWVDHMQQRGKAPISLNICESAPCLPPTP